MGNTPNGMFYFKDFIEYILYLLWLDVNIWEGIKVLISSGATRL